MYVHTHTYTHTQRHMYTHTYMYIHADTCTHVRTYTHIHTHPIKRCSTSLFTHRSGYCTLGGGRENSTHSFLCFHCAIEQSDGSQCQWQIQPELRACSARRPWGTHSPPTIISTHHWQAGEWKFQGLV
ncbi:unnamed protein product [Staurois parvus]|uniref:Uncharacterized protein n=1 Tax=Staurois parvus TaxID=386267 RepID=A0ABN9BR61_9NEOB|nr:unnamed protein product [Staurois parvus]